MLDWKTYEDELYKMLARGDKADDLAQRQTDAINKALARKAEEDKRVEDEKRKTEERINVLRCFMKDWADFIKEYYPDHYDYFNGMTAEEADRKLRTSTFLRFNNDSKFSTSTTTAYNNMKDIFETFFKANNI